MRPWQGSLEFSSFGGAGEHDWIDWAKKPVFKGWTGGSLREEDGRRCGLKPPAVVCPLSQLRSQTQLAGGVIVV